MKRMFLLLVAMIISLSSMAEIDKKVIDLATKGDAESALSIGKDYATGNGVEINFDEAVKWLSIAEKKGNTDAKTIIGMIYAQSGRVHEGLEKIKYSASKNNIKAMIFLGQSYYTGQYVTKDKIQSFSWYKKAADLGDPDAQYNVGIMYGNGDGIPKNYKLSFDMLKSSAESGNINALMSIANRYDAGSYGVNRDIERAFNLYSIAADIGYSEAQYNLGSMYEKGDGTKKNEDKSIEWYTKSAMNGYIPAFYSVAVMNYKKSHPDKLTAYAWFTIASASGNNQSRYWINKLENELPRNGVLEAQDMAANIAKSIKMQ